MIFVHLTGILNAFVSLLSGKDLGDSFISSQNVVLGAYDIEFMSSKNISLILVSSILVFITLVSLIVAFATIHKLKSKN